MSFNPALSAMKGVNAISSMLKKAHSSVSKQSFSSQSAQDNPKTEFLTFGEYANEAGGNYTSGEGSHNIRLLNFVSPDIMLVHQSRMVGFYIKLGKNRELRTVPRDVKNLLLKDVRY